MWHSGKSTMKPMVYGTPSLSLFSVKQPNQPAAAVHAPTPPSTQTTADYAVLDVQATPQPAAQASAQT
jgi:hypothetical protein